MRDLHCHTNYCDGANTPREMAEAALKLGLDTLGFSGHSYTEFDTSWCMSIEGTQAYKKEIRSLADEYRGRLEILCGVEQDFYASFPPDGYDYVIGSVHYLRFGEDYVPVDENPAILAAAADRYCGGDIYALTEKYFETVSDVVGKTHADIIGHFDLICKFNEQHPLFDERHPRYVSAWKKAADELLLTGKPFEINTGAISRGYKTVPYPSPGIMEYLKTNGARFILTSDSHRTDTLCFGFSEWSPER